MLTRNWSEKTLLRQLVVMEENPSELVASNQQIKIGTVDGKSIATYANERSKPIEDYCSIWVFAEGKIEKMPSILILRLMTVTT